MKWFESAVVESWQYCSQICMHHFVSTDICIGAALCTAAGFILFFVQTFLISDGQQCICTYSGWCDSPVFYFIFIFIIIIFYTYVYPRVHGGPGYRQAEQIVVNVYFANCIRQPDKKLQRPIMARVLIVYSNHWTSVKESHLFVSKSMR